MIAGVNGAGKTTSIGKLAHYFQSQGKSVLLAAGDTFRAAAREQLETWGERNNVTVIAQDNGDPAAVVFDAISAAKARGIDIVLADTAGRLPTQLHLMEEIAKVRRVIQKIEPEGPHETLLVLDANIGQNALQQVKAFDKAIQRHRSGPDQARRYGQGRRRHGDRPPVPEADPLHRRRRADRRPAPLRRQGFCGRLFEFE
jgi:fused signal recognition particle receptor